MSYTDVLARIGELKTQISMTSTLSAPAQKPKTETFNVAFQAAKQQNLQPPWAQPMRPLTPLSTNPGLDPTTGSNGPEPSPEVRQAFIASCRKHHVPLAFAMAVGRAESGFRPDAVSGAGAQGVMQLMPATAKGFGVTNSFDPVQNIDAGVRFLHNLLKKFNGDQSLAAAGYNAGPNAVDRFGGIPPYAETQKYVERVSLYTREYANNQMSISTGLPTLQQIT